MTTQDEQPFLRIERRFGVSPEVVFDTLTQPDLMQIWWGDHAEIDIDLRVEGQWTVVRREGDVEYLATGTYLQVERPSCLQYTFAMPQFSPKSDILTVTISEESEGCRLVFEHRGDDIAGELRELPAGETSASEAGWQQGFDLMAEAWAKPA